MADACRYYIAATATSLHCSCHGSSRFDSPDLSRDQMSDAYGDAYSSRSSDEGFGHYGDVVESVQENKARKDADVRQRGATEELHDTTPPEVHDAFDRTQGHEVAEKEVARHSTQETAFEDEGGAQRRRQDRGTVD